jgi:hypothetical protein
MVTVGLTDPPTVTTTGTALPATPAGTIELI